MSAQRGVKFTPIMINGELNNYIRLYKEEMTDPVLHKSDNHFAVWQTLKFMMNIGFSHSRLGSKSQLIIPSQLTLRTHELKSRVEEIFNNANLSVSTYRRILKYFHKEKRLNLKTSPSGSVISLCCYCGLEPKFPTTQENEKRTPTNDLPQGDSRQVKKDHDNSIGTTRKEDFNYCEIAEDGITNRRNIITAKEFQSREFDSPNSYVSIYNHLKTLYDYVQSNKKVAGYTGLKYGERLIFDIDRLTNPDRGLKDLNLFLDGLHYSYGVDYDQILVHFSGYKGFHVCLSEEQFGGWEPSEHLHRLHGKLAEEIAKETATVIDMAIYTENRMIRIPDTKHSESGLYKVEIPMSMIRRGDIKPIFERAKAPCGSQFPFEFLECKSLKLLWYDVRTNFRFSDSSGDYRKLRYKKPCVEVLIKGVRQGERYNSALRIADYLKKRGRNQEFVQNYLFDWAPKCSPAFNESDEIRYLNKIVVDVFKDDEINYGCYDWLLERNCSKGCENYPRLKRKRQSNTKRK
jgi:hypothetical protein